MTQLGSLARGGIIVKQMAIQAIVTAAGLGMAIILAFLFLKKAGLLRR